MHLDTIPEIRTLGGEAEPKLLGGLSYTMKQKLHKGNYVIWLVLLMVRAVCHQGSQPALAQPKGQRLVEDGSKRLELHILGTLSHSKKSLAQLWLRIYKYLLLKSGLLFKLCTIYSRLEN